MLYPEASYISRYDGSQQKHYQLHNYLDFEYNLKPKYAKAATMKKPTNSSDKLSTIHNSSQYDTSENQF